jgi:hypothetical protein
VWSLSLLVDFMVGLKGLAHTLTIFGDSGLSDTLV